ncbi:MAG: TIGR03619 family F420-dependent LLM class oxidoreductase [Dehalococcoidia bacterium]
MKVLAGLPVHMFVRDARQGNPGAIARIVGDIEAMGFWGVSVSHHLFDPGLSTLGHAGGELVNWRYADPIAMLSYLAAVSKTLRLMPWVMVLPYRQPVELAHGLATIDSLSGGRLIFGAGAGSQESEFRLVGASRKERGRITDEWLDIVIELWTNPKATFAGRYHRFENLNLAVKPVQRPRPPNWIGGASRAAVRRAIRVGDVWAPPAFGFPREGAAPAERGSVTVSELKEEMAWANQQRQALGKPPLQCVASSGIPLTFLERSEGAAPRSRSEVAYFTARGTPEELLEEYLAFKEAGADYAMVKFTGDTPEDYLRDAETFASRIMPGLQ